MDATVVARAVSSFLDLCLIIPSKASCLVKDFVVLVTLVTFWTTAALFCDQMFCPPEEKKCFLSIKVTEINLQKVFTVS